jgi:D-aminopeptidase
MRLRDQGIRFGTLPTGTHNAITDVPGVRVGHATLMRGDRIRTGVTAILPHSGNLFRRKVPGAVHVGNAFGKLIGSTQVNELGEIETPICLTATLNSFRVADAVLDHMLSLPGNEDVRSINPLVGETNDGALNDIRARAVGHDEVLRAIQSAKDGPVDEGSVGAGAGTIAFGWKGGIGTASRKVGPHTLGVLVQSNFGGRLTINGVPMADLSQPGGADGSIMMVVATDAPIRHRNLQRLAARTMLGLGRTGSSGSNGSGDYAIAFSTASAGPELANDAMSPLFAAVIEATEEAIINSMTQATSVTGNGRTVPAIPVDEVLRRLKRAAF